MRRVLREITPLAKDTLFFSKNTPNDIMDFPLHFHEDYEITLTLGAKGAERIIGPLVETISDKDLVLLGPETLHYYRQASGHEGEAYNVSVIQFDRDLGKDPFFSKEHLNPIREMLEACGNGIRFSQKTASELEEKIVSLHSKHGIEGILQFIDILYHLAIAEDKTFISAFKPLRQNPTGKGVDKINLVLSYVEDNYTHKITLPEIAAILGISPTSASRSFRRKTGRSFQDYLNDYRIDRAANLLIRTAIPISEVCYSCGFNNVSNFNRAFRKRLGMPPGDYRKDIRRRAAME